MYRKINDFISDLQMESGNTIKIFKSVDSTKKSFQINKNIRTPEGIAWHITLSISEMKFRSGLSDKDELEGQPLPENMNEIIQIYSNQVNSLTESIQRSWTDAILEEGIEIFGEKWSRGKTLRSIITHEIHHRGQLTSIMRILDMIVPGIYGPSKEEWAKFNLPAME